MSRRMLINAREPEESRVAVATADGRLDEYYVERTGDRRLLGNIFKGRVINVEPSFQAAFVDFGADINGFLHASDVMPIYGRNARLDAGRTSTGKLDIATLLRPNQEVLVQVTKDPIGNKGPSLTTFMSLPGRYLVLMPSISRSGVSKRIEDDAERRLLKARLSDLNPPKGMGYIIRTAGLDTSKEDLQRDLEYLLSVWRSIVNLVKRESSPAAVYQESDLVMRVIRDFYADDVEEIWVDSEPVFERTRTFLEQISPTSVDRLHFYADRAPLFHRHGVEEAIEKIFLKQVHLPNGGSLVVEQTEALVAIDVNSGRYKGERDAETTAYKTNLEAVPEVARQLRLRDVGGLVVVDFIDMVDERRRREVERALRQAMRRDRARTRVGRMSQFCMVEMTRQRVRHSLMALSHQACPVCRGGGYVKTPESMALKIVRIIKRGLAEADYRRADVQVHPVVANFLQNRMRRSVADLETILGKSVHIEGDYHFQAEDYRVTFHRPDGRKFIDSNIGGGLA